MFTCLRKVLLLIVFISPVVLFAQSKVAFKETPAELKTETGLLRGSLLAPANKKVVPIVLIISGSGPTDRNGNNPMMKNNHLKMLAEALAQ